jgi:hypothetical protein
MLPEAGATPAVTKFSWNTNATGKSFRGKEQSGPKI